MCLYSVRGADAGNGIRVFIPDIGMFIAGLVTWFLCRSLEKPPGKDILQHNTDFDIGNQVRFIPDFMLLKDIQYAVFERRYTFTVLSSIQYKSSSISMKHLAPDY